MDSPTRKSLSRKKRAHSASINVPLVWTVLTMRWPGRAWRRSYSRERRKKSSPMSVGSPPCQATVTSGAGPCASISWRMYSCSMSSAIRNLLPSYSSSLERKKQYVQSRLQIAPVGLARRWKACRGAAGSGRRTVGRAAIRCSWLPPWRRDPAGWSPVVGDPPAGECRGQFLIAAAADRPTSTYWRMLPLDPESPGSPRSNAEAMEKVIAVPTVVASATPARKPSTPGRPGGR